MGLKTSYFTNLILSTGRGYNKGMPSNAKPLYLLAIIEGISNGTLIGNKLNYDDTLLDLYREVCERHEPWSVNNNAKVYQTII